MLHEGPLAFEAAESRRVRARFLAASGWGDPATLVEELERRDRTLADASHVVLWFEHDLYDQLQLLQILSQLRDDQDVELVQADEHLGPLGANALEALWKTRRRLDTDTLDLARETWRALCAGETPVAGVRALPHLAPALRRLTEERAPLRRTKRQLLAALASGASTPLELFAANQSMEEAAFLGDTWCFRFVHELAEDGLLEPADGALPAPPPRGDYDAFVSTPLALTAAGRAAIAADN